MYDDINVKRGQYGIKRYNPCSISEQVLYNDKEAMRDYLKGKGFNVMLGDSCYIVFKTDAEIKKFKKMFKYAMNTNIDIWLEAEKKEDKNEV